MNQPIHIPRSIEPYVVSKEKEPTPTHFNLEDKVYLEAKYDKPSSIEAIYYWKGKIGNTMNAQQIEEPPYDIQFDIHADEYTKGLLLFETPDAPNPLQVDGKTSCTWDAEQLFSSREELASYLIKWLQIPTRSTTPPNPKEATRLIETMIKTKLERFSNTLENYDPLEAQRYFIIQPRLEPRDLVYIVVEDENKLPKMFKVPIDGYKMTRWYECGCTCEKIEYCFRNPLTDEKLVVDRLGDMLFINKDEALEYATQCINQRLGITND